MNKQYFKFLSVTLFYLRASQQKQGLFLEKRVANSYKADNVFCHPQLFKTFFSRYRPYFCRLNMQGSFLVKKVSSILNHRKSYYDLDLTLLIYPDKFFMPHIDIQQNKQEGKFKCYRGMKSHLIFLFWFKSENIQDFLLNLKRHFKVHW